MSQLGELLAAFTELHETNRAIQVALAELQARESRVATHSKVNSPKNNTPELLESTNGAQTEMQ